MYSGLDARHCLDEMLRRQEEIRTRARREAMSRETSHGASLRSPVAFRLWRLHVMLWLEGARRT